MKEEDESFTVGKRDVKRGVVECVASREETRRHFKLKRAEESGPVSRRDDFGKRGAIPPAALAVVDGGGHGTVASEDAASFQLQLT